MGKRLCFVWCYVLLFPAFCLAQSEDSTGINPAAAVSFEVQSIDFGIVTQKDSLVREIKFKNTGTVPFKFYDGVSECGCGKIILPDKATKPGKNGTLLLIFKSPYLGMVEKKITLVSNAGIHYLIYKAYVKE